ncbi:hypothetical protein FKM82_019979 [Ascaphus truei]
MVLCRLMSKTELLIRLPKPGPTAPFCITVGSAIIHPVSQARCLGVTCGSSLTCSYSQCNFFLHTIAKIRPFLCCSTGKTNAGPHSLLYQLL